MKGASTLAVAWCGHCYRTYDGYETNPTAPLTRCPLCDGSAWDQFPWHVMRRDYPELPETPTAGERYTPDKRPGMYYTPEHILRVIDPAAGSGAWLGELAGNPPWGGGA